MGGDLEGKGRRVEGLVYYVAGRCCDCLAVISFSGGSDPLDWPLSSPTVPDPPPIPRFPERPDCYELWDRW